MRKVLVIAAGGLIGLMAGYFMGAFVACTWLYPTSNLCGIYGVFVTGPIGLVCGAVGGWLIVRGKNIHQTGDLLMDELRRCDKCSYETLEVLPLCPKCGARLLSILQIRKLGWALLAIGLFLVGVMGTITSHQAPIMLRPGVLIDGSKFTGTAEQGLLTLCLFGIVFVFGLISGVMGLSQIRTGRRNKWMLYCLMGLLVLLSLTAGLLMQALGI